MSWAWNVRCSPPMVQYSVVLFVESFHSASLLERSEIHYVCMPFESSIFGLSKITLRAQYIIRTYVSYISDPNVILIGELPPMSRRTLAYIHTYSVRGACCGRLPASPKNEKISASILPPQCSECLILPVHIYPQDLCM